MIQPHASFRIEALESRIAPAAAIPPAILHPVADIVVGPGTTGKLIDLGQVFDSAANTHTKVRFVTNYDNDPLTPGIQGDIVFELFDDTAPLTVQNFLRYVNNPNLRGDYDGTIFHRAVYLEDNVTPFVLQGGGYEAARPGVHIPVGLPVHNEFDPQDASRSNVTGTIAMAKTPRGPDTATSEFFINLGDNSANLDIQNGGFTVFGKVIEGMDVVNAIAKERRMNFSGTGTLPKVNPVFDELPVAPNYSLDPDNNLLTHPPLPAAKNYITITNAMVEPPVDSHPAGFSYKVLSVTNPVTNAPSDLVTATLTGTTGDNLALKFANARTGLAVVTVEASSHGAKTPVQIRVILAPNLTAEIASDTLPAITVPGDSVLVKTKLGNNGGSNLTAKIEIKYYLSKVTAADSTGGLFEPGVDLPIGASTVAVNLRGGTSILVPTKIQIPRDLLESQDQFFRIIAIAQPAADTPVPELFTNDNGDSSVKPHILENAFGTFDFSTFDLATNLKTDPGAFFGIGADATGLRKNVPLHYTDSAGQPVTLTLTGGGAGKLNVTGSEFDVLTLKTKITSVLTAKVGIAGMHTTLGKLVVIPGSGLSGGQSPVGTVNFGSVDLHGQVQLHDGARRITLGNLQGGTASPALEIGVYLPTPKAPVAVTLGQVSDYNLLSYAPLSTFKAVNWLNVNAARESLQIPSVTGLTITQNLEADFFANDPAGPKTAAFTVGGALSNSVVSLQASVGAVKLGAMKSSLFYVGVTALPTATADFELLPRTIGTFTVKDAIGSPNAFQNSQIVAATIGRLSLQSLDPATGTAGSVGVVTHAISSFLRGGIRIPVPLTPGSHAVDQVFSVRVF